MTGSKFLKGADYSRAQIADQIGLPADRQTGNWETGYSRWDGAIYLFCNVGIAGQTGHDYPNAWEGDELIWYGKTGSHRDQPLIKEMISGSVPVHVFWRSQQRSPFSYAGAARAVEVSDDSPVQVRWAF
jgi:hypothetical protein